MWLYVCVCVYAVLPKMKWRRRNTQHSENPILPQQKNYVIVGKHGKICFGGGKTFFNNVCGGCGETYGRRKKINTHTQKAGINNFLVDNRKQENSNARSEREIYFSTAEKFFAIFAFESLT